jgi:hypothetical protein
MSGSAARRPTRAPSFDHRLRRLAYRPGAEPVDAPHDLGGRMNFGSVCVEPDEPVFDARREAVAMTAMSVGETKLIEANAEFHARVVRRLANPDRLIPVEQVFGRLEDD